MTYVTELMNKLFSDSTPDELKKEVSDKIEEAKTNGQAELKTDEEHLSFAEADGDVVIEDKKNGNEITIAKDAGDEYKLEGKKPETKMQSATQPDAVVPKPAGEDKAPLPEGSTEPNVKVTIEEAISDEDKAGMDKQYSVVFSGFESPEAAQRFYSEMVEESISFSETELENVAFSATELNEQYERLLGTQDLQLAYSVLEGANELAAYANLAETRGFSMEDVLEATEIYSEVASEVIMNTFSEMDINEFFSEMTEEEINAYFSELDEVETQVLYSALCDENETYTFSEVEDVINECYSEIELQTPVTEFFSESTEDEVNEFFSELSEVEYNVVFSMIEEDENVSFSEINDALEVINQPLNEMFSNMTDEEVELFSDTYGDFSDLAIDMVEMNPNVTYSEFLEVVNEMCTFSDADVAQIKENAEQIKEAADKMKEGEGDVELAKKVKVLADKCVEDAEIAEAQGHDCKEAKEMCAHYSEQAAEVLDKAGVKPEDIKPEEVLEPKKEDKPVDEFDSADKDHDGKVAKNEWLDAKLPEEDFEKVDSDHDGVISKEEFKAYKEPKKDEPKDAEPKTKLDAEQKVESESSAEQKVESDKEEPKSFSKVYLGIKPKSFSANNEVAEQKAFGKVELTKSVNPFLKTSIN